MKNALSRDLGLLAIVAMPFIYLAAIWNGLPDIVPIHWNIRGEIDGTGSKKLLILIPILLPLLTYSIFTLLPQIDPKGEVNRMGDKLDKLKFWLTSFMAVLATYILYVTKAESMINPNVIIIMIGLMFLLLGNYSKTLKPNYFIGIRTPWTLEDEMVWKATHKMAGVLWVMGGLLIIICALILDIETNFPIFIVLILLLALIPIGYSYWLFKNGQYD